MLGFIIRLLILTGIILVINGLSVLYSREALGAARAVLASIALAGGVTALVGAAIMQYRKALTPGYEGVDQVLLDLAGRKSIGVEGVRERIVLRLRSRGVSGEDLSRLIDVVSKARGVSVEAAKGRFSLTYELVIRGPTDSARAAAGDILEFCERTGKCEARYYTSG